MTLAKVLADIDGDAGSESVARAALQLGQDFAARVELLHIELMEEQTIPIVAEGMTSGAIGQMLESLSEERQARAEAAEGLYQRLCVEAGLETCGPDDPPEPGRFRVAFRRVVGLESEELSRSGRLADMVVVRGPVTDVGVSQAVETAMFETGRPMLMVPETLPERLGASIAVSWDGTLGAARAAGAALPLLARAETVSILTADMEKVGAKPSALAAYLAEHGIEARTWAFLKTGSGELRWWRWPTTTSSAKSVSREPMRPWKRLVINPL